MDGRVTSSIESLFARLHRGLLALAAEASKLTGMNSSVNASEVREAREEIIKRLSGGEGIEESRTMLKILDLFSKDSAFIEIVKDDADEWLEFLDAIEKNLGIIVNDLEGEDRKVAERTLEAVEKAKAMIRK